MDNNLKILIVSNNSLSDTKNNGKTISSFFSCFDHNNMAQIYFKNENPTGKKIKTYYRIKDTDIVKSVFFKRRQFGEEITLDKNDINHVNVNEKLFPSKLLKSNTLKLIREFFWKIGKWNTKKLNNWLDDFSPNIIFFCAGDSIFAYDIVKYISTKYNAKLVTYVTDDYILPRFSFNFIWHIRRILILNKIKLILLRTNLFITISNKMKFEYIKVFNKDSIVAMNMSPRTFGIEKPISKEVYNLVYAGGMHFNRDKVLLKLIKTIKKLNNTSSNFKMYLNIYSTSNLSKQMQKKFDVENVSSFKGALSNIDLIEVYKKCDILVHVESFDSKSISSTKLSISTKISEYLSTGKAIIAIGPKNIASIEFLKDTALCITNPLLITKELETFSKSYQNMKSFSCKTEKKYNELINSQLDSREFYKRMIDLIKNN